MKKKLHFYILTLSMLCVNLIFAQDYTDYLVDENNTKIFCKITQVKNGKVKYRLRGKSYSTIKTITKFTDVNLTNPDVIKNPLGLKIETPEPGYAYVYFYYSGIIYKVKHNGQKLTNIGIGRYYLHKIKAGETHNYSCFGNDLEILAENQKTYLIRGQEFGTTNNYGNYSEILSENQNTHPTIRISVKLVLDDRKISEYALLSMRKKAE